MGQPLSVLIIEDRHDDAELLAAELRRSGFDVTWTRVDTYALLDSALDATPDLVVCDYSLPGMDPFEVLDRLRDRAPDVPVIVISGVVDEDVATALFPHGARDLLLKDRLARLGQSVATVLEVRDLALDARQAAERERRTASLLSALVDHAPAAISVLDPDGVPLLMNTRFHELRRQGLQESLLARSTDGDQDGEVQLGDDTHLWMSFRVWLDEGSGSATGMILLDITRQKQIEQQLLAARVELASQAQELRNHNAELLKLDGLKTDLLNTVSHELRTPLTSILGYSELLTDQESAGPGTAAHRMVDMISRNSQRLLNLIDNLLLLAQLDGVAASAGVEPDRAAAVDLAELAESVVSVIMPTAAVAGLRMVTRFEPPPPAVHGNRDELEQVLTNLASNAVKFSKPSGTVTLRIRQEPGWAVLEVTDTGIGMTADELAHVGVRFFRGDSARSEHVPGTGLGVSVARSIVARHHGSLEYRSAPGGGTTATVRLPLGQSDA